MYKISLFKSQSNTSIKILRTNIVTKGHASLTAINFVSKQEQSHNRIKNYLHSIQH